MRNNYLLIAGVTNDVSENLFAEIKAVSTSIQLFDVEKPG